MIVRVGRMTEAELLSSGFTTDHVRIPQEHGGGYLMELEMSHQLHCLVSILFSHSFTLSLETV